MASMQINIGDHTSSEAGLGYVAFPPYLHDRMRWVRRRARWIARNKSNANSYFSGLGEGRSLTDLLADNSIWINYNSSMGGYGETTEYIGSKEKEIAITGFACRLGRWTMLATLIHELAHVAGAGGGGQP